MERRKKVLVAVITVFLLLAYLKRYEKVSTFLGLYLIAVGYLTGIIAVLLKTLLFLIALLTSLPIISTFYAYLLVALGRVHTYLFKTAAKKALSNNKHYRDLELKVKNSDFYLTVNHRLRALTNKNAVKRPTGIKFYEVAPCNVCGGEIPLDSKYCFHCGKEQG